MKTRFLLSGVVLWVAQVSFAVDNFTPSNLSALSNENVENLIKTVAIGSDHHAYMPPSPLGYAIGIDVGIDFTLVSLNDNFRSALAVASNRSINQVPSLIPLPKINLHKGLPFGVDVGFTFLKYQDFITTMGGDVKWTFVDGGLVKPNIAARFSGNYSKLWYFLTHNYSIDVMGSKAFSILEPYGGLGLQFWSGDLLIPAGTSGLPANVSGHKSSTNPRLFGGLALELGLFRFVTELDYSFAGLLTYGGKFSLSF